MSMPDDTTNRAPGTGRESREINENEPTLSAAQLMASALAAQPSTTPVPSELLEPANLPLVGQLNTRELIFYLKASAQLRTIIQSAPAEVRSRIRSNASREAILEEILRNDEEFEDRVRGASLSNPQGALIKLVVMSPSEIEHLAETNLPALQRLMITALPADSSMSPRHVPQSQHDTLITALKWQVHAHRTAIKDTTPGADCPVQVSEPPPPQLSSPAQERTANQASQPTPSEAQRQNPSLDDLLMQAHPQRHPVQQGHDEDDSDGDALQARRGIKRGLTVDNWVKGFRVGLNAGLEQILSTYPGNRPGANRLNVNELRGPRILARIIVRGKDLEQHVAEFAFWRRTANGNPMQAEMEAHTLGRYMHLEILTHKSPLEALRHRPSLQIGLRRLYAILFVEQRMVQGESPDRRSAWMDIEFLLESTPNDAAPCDEIEDEMTRRLSQYKKRISANKAIQDSESSKSKRQNRGSRSNGSQGNRHRKIPNRDSANENAGRNNQN